jgi:predicted nucleic acid-binding protein
MHRNSARLYLSVITIAEVEDGIAKNRRLGARQRLSV